MDYTYTIPELMNSLIKDLEKPFLTEKIRELYIIGFKERFNITASTLNLEELQEISTYMQSYVDNANTFKNALSNLFSFLDAESKLDDGQRRLSYGVLDDRQKQVSQLQKTLDISLEVVKIGMDELTKYLPSDPSVSVSEKKLVPEGSKE